MTRDDYERMSWYQRDKLYLKLLSERERLQQAEGILFAPRKPKPLPAPKPKPEPREVKARIYKSHGVWYLQRNGVDIACASYGQAVEMIEFIVSCEPSHEDEAA